MHVVKVLAVFFLAVYLVVVGLQGMGATLAFVHPGVIGFIAFVAGVLFFVKGVKLCCHGCTSCDKPPYDKP